MSPPWPELGEGDSDSDAHGEVGRQAPKKARKPRASDEGEEGDEERSEEEKEAEEEEEEEEAPPKDRHARIHYEDYLQAMRGLELDRRKVAPLHLPRHLTVPFTLTLRARPRGGAALLGARLPMHASPRNPFTSYAYITHEPIHPFTHAPMHPFTHAPMHTCTHAPMHPFTRSSVHPCTHAPSPQPRWRRSARRASSYA